jgi:hypothetical protein
MWLIRDKIEKNKPLSFLLIHASSITHCISLIQDAIAAVVLFFADGFAGGGNVKTAGTDVA